MKLFHVIRTDSVIYPKRGLIIERYDDKTDVINIIVGFIGWQLFWCEFDYGRYMARTRFMYWLRFTFICARGDPKWVKRPTLRSRFQFARGRSAADAIDYDAPNQDNTWRNVKVYRGPTKAILDTPPADRWSSPA